MSCKLATIIGGHGYIGHALAEHLRQAGWLCFLPERTTDWPLNDRPLGHVFYCAGLTADYLQRPAATIEAHVSLLARVLQSADYHSLVYLSSTRLYDKFPAGSLANESMTLTVLPAAPRDLYDLSKLTGESLCHALGQGKARVARLASVYGRSAHEEGFLPALLARVAAAPRETTLAVESSPSFARDYVHLSDVIRALVDIAERGTQTIYNVASGVNLRNDQLAEMIAAQAGRQISFTGNAVCAEPAQVDVSRLRSEFAWQPASVAAHLGPWLSALGAPHEIA